MAILGTHSPLNLRSPFILTTPSKPEPEEAPLSNDELMETFHNTFHHWTRYLEEYVQNPDRVPVTTYEAMYLSDETVFSSIESMIMSCLARMGEFTFPEPEIEEFIRQQLEEMEGNFSQAVADIMSAWVYGFSCTEILWRSLPGGKIGLRGLQTLHPDTIKLDIYRSGPNKNKLKSVRQFFRMDKHIDIPLQKCIVYTHNGKFGNPYGTSRLKRVYKNWKIKDVILKAWGLTCERYGSPYTIAKTTGIGRMNDPVTGVEISTAENMLRVTKALGLRGSAVIDANDSIDIKYGSANFGATFAELVGYLNKMIYRGIGLPSLITDNGNVGSHSLGKEHFKLFYLSLEHLFYEVQDVLIEQLIKPLIKMNFGEQESYGQFVLDQFQMEDAKTLAETFESLTRSGLMSADKLDDINAFRERLGVELWTEEDLEISAPPAITGLEPMTADPTVPPIAPELEEANKPKPKVYSYSLAERRRNSRRIAGKRWSSPDEMAEVLARFAELTTPA